MNHGQLFDRFRAILINEPWLAGTFFSKIHLILVRIKIILIKKNVQEQ